MDLTNVLILGGNLLLQNMSDDIEDVEKYAAGQPRDSHGRFASGGGNAIMYEANHSRAGGRGWEESPIKLTKIGTKELPVGWDYIPASKAPAQLADRMFSNPQSTSHLVATNYYGKLAKAGELEVYKHSSGLWITVEGSQVNSSPDAKNRLLQNASDLYKANKGLIDGPVLIRVNEQVTKWRGNNTAGWAADERHTNARPYGRTDPRSVALDTGAKNITLINLTPRTVKLTLAHEFGHVIRYSTDKPPKLWFERGKPNYVDGVRGESLRAAVSRRPRIHVSMYGKNNDDEWYAEVFTQFIMNNGTIPNEDYYKAGDQAWLNNFAKDQGWRMPK